MNPAITVLADALSLALSEGREALHEHEVYGALSAAGLPVPSWCFVPAGEEPRLPPALRDGPVVLKVVAPEILHKSDVGGVRMVPGAEVDRASLGVFLAEVGARWRERHGADATLLGTLVVEAGAVPPRPPSRAEVLVGMRWSADFGFVGMVGLGGVKAEVWGARLPRAEGNALFLLGAGREDAALKELPPRWSTRTFRVPLRGLEGHRHPRRLEAPGDPAGGLRGRLFARAGRGGPPRDPGAGDQPRAGGRPAWLVPADALVRVGTSRARAPERPVEKLAKLFEPRTVAVAGRRRRP